MKLWHKCLSMKKSDMMKRIQYSSRFFVLLFSLCIVFNQLGISEVGYADSTSQVKIQADYVNEIITLTPGTGGSAKFYMSTDNMKSWEVVDSSGVIDLSVLLSTRAVTLWFRGNKDTNPISYTLPAESNTINVKFSVASGAGLITYTPQVAAVSGAGLTTNTPQVAVEYKKGQFGRWITASNNMSTAIYEIRGATLYYRTPPTADTRAGKVIMVKIPKRPSPPAVRVDSSKLSISGLKSGETQYRIGGDSVWTTFTTTDTKVKSLSLLSILSPNAAPNSQIPAGTIEFRSLGNDKKLNSAVKTFDILTQPVVPDNYISVAGTTITISDPDVKRTYEYTLVAQGKFLDLETARWSSVTSKKAVTVKNASVGDRFYIRLKYSTSVDKQQILASTYKEIIITSITLN